MYVFLQSYIYIYVRVSAHAFVGMSLPVRKLSQTISVKNELLGLNIQTLININKRKYIRVFMMVSHPYMCKYIWVNVLC